ncbi:hypothetical protein [Arachidicoccus sp.]|uniref:hypothetical protein n=1 Tax=Arachidicoccus sp. TaxID=1872624 RepID=UPI003D1D8CC0
MLQYCPLERTSLGSWYYIVTTILIGASKTASGTLTMEIGDGKSGDNIWRFTKSMNESLFSSTDNLVGRMMRKVS